MKKGQAIFFCIFVLFLTVLNVPACFAVDAIEAISSINQAEFELNSAFEAVAIANNVGAHVGILLDDLEVASSFLTNAYTVFRYGDYETAILLAMKCKTAVEGIDIESDRLEAEAIQTKTNTILFKAFWTGIGLIILLVLSFIGWRVLKKWYFKQVLKMKPNVEEAK